jgi:hypothetical protein
MAGDLSHEFRGPRVAIRGWAELVGDGPGKVRERLGSTDLGFREAHAALM